MHVCWYQIPGEILKEMSVIKRLLIFLFLVRAVRQHVTMLALIVGLHLESELGQLGEHVLELGVGLGAGLAAKVVESRDDREDVVGDSEDDGDTNGVTPDDNDSDDVDITVDGVLVGVGAAGVGLVVFAGQPAEDTEEGGQGIDNTDGTNQLPGRPSLSTAGDEDEPVLSEGNLEEQNLLGGTEVLDDTEVGQEEGATQDPGSASKHNTENDRDDPDLGQLPLDWTGFEVSIVVGDGDGGQVSEKGNEHNQVGTDGLVDDKHGGDQVDFQVNTQGNTVLDISLHTLEDLTGKLDSIDDGAQTGGKEDDIGGGLGGFGRALDSNTAVSLLQGRSVVDTVTSHGSKMSTLLEHLDDLVLVLGEHLGETIGLLDKVVLGRTSQTTVDQALRVVDLGAQGKHLASFLGNSEGVTSQHLDRETKGLGSSDSVGGILTRGVEHGIHAKKLPGLTLPLDGDTERTETTAGEFGSLVPVETGLLLAALGGVEDSLGGTLDGSVADTVTGADGGNTLGDRIERSVLLGDPVAREDLTGLGVPTQGKDRDFIDGVQALDVVRRGNGGDSHHPVDINTLRDVGLTDGQLVGREGTGLVGAQDVDTGKGLNGSELLDNGLLLSEISGTDGKGSGGDDGQTDGDTNDKENQSPVQQVVITPFRGGDLDVTVETTNPGSENPEHDQDEERGTDVVHDSLEVTLVLGTLDESGGLTDEGVLGSSGNNGVGLATLATGGVVAGIAHVLVDSKGFTSDGGLVNGDDGDTSVGGGHIIIVVILALLLHLVVLDLGEHLLVGFVHLRLLVVTDETDIGRDDMSLFNDDL